MLISVVIPTCAKEIKLIKNALDSIINHTYHDLELIIVANGCSEDVLEYLTSQSSQLPYLYLLVYEEPLGYTKAINEGIKKTSGEFIVLLNDDIVILDNTWIPQLLFPFHNPSVGITGPLMSFCPHAERAFLLFFCVMIKRSVFDKIGLLDEIFNPGYGEDADFCIKAENAGFELIQVPNNEISRGQEFMVGSFPIYHVGGASFPKIADEGLIERNSTILRKRYVEEFEPSAIKRKYSPIGITADIGLWKYFNNFERVVVSRTGMIAEREFQRYKWIAENLYGTSILEIGCSSGYGRRFLPENIDYLGIDKDEEIIKFANRQFGDIAKFQVCDLHEFTFDKKYDTIIICETLEHIDDGREIAQKLKEHCHTLLCSVPYKEFEGGWGEHHKLHNLTERDFPGFRYEVRIYPPISEMLLKWEETMKPIVEPILDYSVTATICTKDRYFSTLPLAINSILHQTLKPKYLMIYDDGEHTDLRKYPLYQGLFDRLSHEGIEWEVLLTPGNGQVLNHQKALLESKTDYVWRMDDDCIAEPDVLEKSVAHLKRNPNLAAVGGSVIDPTKIFKKIRIASNKIEDIYLGCNIQWFLLDPIVYEVDHLYSSFVYRRSLARSYCLDLSPVGHREETMFTYDMKKAGHDVIVDGSIRTWHHKFPKGGIRSYHDKSFWDYDEEVFRRYLQRNKVTPKDIRVVVLDCGLGDHYMFKEVLREMLIKFSSARIIVSCCYPEVFEDIISEGFLFDDIEIISIEDAKIWLGDAAIDRLNVYKYIIDSGEQKTITEGFRELYLK